MKEPTMVYRAGGPHELHGHQVDYQIIDASEVDDALADGWFLTPSAAGDAGIAAAEAVAAEAQALAEMAKANLADLQAKDAERAAAEANKPPTRAELEAKAEELGLTFDRRSNDRKLLQKIDAELARRAADADD